MSIWHITGGSPLRGQIRVQGSKNAVLPVIAASLLCGAETELLNCPNLSDVDAAMDILRYLGCTAARCGDALCIDTTAPARCDIPRELMHRMRSSVIFLGPLLVTAADLRLNMLVTQNDVVFVGKVLELGDDLQRMRHVDDEHAEKYADKDRNTEAECNCAGAGFGALSSVDFQPRP